ncbi:hypothetical protein ACH4U3_30310 [Streptomyces griseoruber]|uniref:hypothetical protein n=1 Tax=Streptomyces griseoruber TaxID=1943 RepID=UPI0037B85DBD
MAAQILVRASGRTTGLRLGMVRNHNGGPPDVTYRSFYDRALLNVSGDVWQNPGTWSAAHTCPSGTTGIVVLVRRHCVSHDDLFSPRQKTRGNPPTSNAPLRVVLAHRAVTVAPEETCTLVLWAHDPGG